MRGYLVKFFNLSNTSAIVVLVVALFSALASYYLLGESVVSSVTLGSVTIIPWLVITLHIRSGARHADLIEAVRRDIGALSSKMEIDSKRTSREDRGDLERRLTRHDHIVYSQIEAFHNINKKIDLKEPLPSMSGWAATPDLISKIIDVIQDNDIRTVVDLGSGVSTIASGYAIKGREGGKVISLDHDMEYMHLTADAIKRHGLDEQIDLRHAPLTEQRVGGDKYRWYDRKSLKGVGRVDLLIVDGPPMSTQELARFPALPVLYDKLSNGAVVIVDDYARKDERSMVDAWLDLYPGEFKCTELRGLKGMAVLNRVSKQ